MEDNYFEKIRIGHLLERKEQIAKELKLRVLLLLEHRNELHFLLKNNASSAERSRLIIMHKSEIVELRAINQDQWVKLLNRQKEELRSFTNIKSDNQSDYKFS